MRPDARMLLKSALVLSGLLPGMAARAQTAAPPVQANAHLQAFGSQQELDGLLVGWHRKVVEARRGRQDRASAVGSGVPSPAPASPSPASPVALESPGTLGSVTVMGTAASANDSITNNQTQGVDEGDIVKRSGDFLIILRRGRLFSLRIGGDALQPVSHVDAYAPGVDPQGTWYDEMLVSGSNVVVIGYSYGRSATELGLFTLAADGTLRYRDTYYLRSNDYYDSRNYASRLIGTTLLFYTPLYYDPESGTSLVYPGLARRPKGDASMEFKRLLPAEAIYRADAGLDPLIDAITLHTVTRCELAGAAPRCTATAVLGPSGDEFYVSRNAVYVWTDTGSTEGPGYVLRMPLDGGPVSALQVRGIPIDQMSFFEDDGGSLNVVVQSQGNGVGMWRSEWGSGRLALLRTPLTAFGSLQASTPDAAYRFLPPVSEGDRQNRFIGDWLVYGASSYRWRRHDDTNANPAYAVRYAQPDTPIRMLPLAHDVQRIDAMGADAVLVGPQADDLVFSTAALESSRASLRSRFVLAGASQGESRTHGYSYRRDGDRLGVIGLPVLRTAADTKRPFAGAPSETASVLYLRNDALRLSRLGELDAQAKRLRDDHCKASCVDWYGNARPIFIGPRVFALMGYELVEGTLLGDRIRERRRVDFAPE